MMSPRLDARTTAKVHCMKLALGCAASVMALTFSAPSQAADIQLDPGTKYQTMLGWETMLRGWEVNKIANNYDPTWLEQAPIVLDRLVNELGINRVRLEFRSGYENPVNYYTQFLNGEISYTTMKEHWYEKINDNDDPNVVNAPGFQFAEFDYLVENELLPLKALVEANGEQLYVNLCHVDFNWQALHGNFELALNPDEYAELTQVFFEHLRDKYGVIPDGLEIILEPENTDAWRGTQIGQAIVAVTSRLSAAGFNPEIAAPSTAFAPDTLPYFSDILAVPGAVEAMTTLSYHRYTPGDYAAIFSAADSHGLVTGMLENTDGDADNLFEDLTTGNISNWQKFGIAVTSASNDIAYYRADFSDPANPVIALGPDATLLLPYMRFVRRGASRIDAQSNDPAYRPLAFINANEGYVVVVKASSTGTVDVSGLPDGTYGVKIATVSGGVSDGADVTPTSGMVSLSVPIGVTAIYDKRALEGAAGSGGSGGSGGNAAPGGSTGSGGTFGGAVSTGGAISASGGIGFAGAGGTPSSGGAPGGSPAMSSKQESGCGCRTPATPTSGAGALFTALACAVTAVSRWRRRRSTLHASCSAPATPRC
ncbi:MAG TPA: hypothetical protein VGP93_17050 [Polyangiaceae bacterium]|nr:hypothetical protein [Polyangiaceae bacterium]